MDVKKDLAIVFVSAGVMNDGGGFIILGNGRVIRIPPWNPEVRAILEATAQLVAAEPHIKDAALRQQVQQTATQLAHSVAAQVNHAVEGAH